jgi:hypothetical protein
MGEDIAGCNTGAVTPLLQRIGLSAKQGGSCKRTLGCDELFANFL